MEADEWPKHGTRPSPDGIPWNSMICCFHLTQALELERMPCRDDVRFVWWIGWDCYLDYRIENPGCFRMVLL
jgi:hypothetical protein